MRFTFALLLAILSAATLAGGQELRIKKEPYVLAPDESLSEVEQRLQSYDLAIIANVSRAQYDQYLTELHDAFVAGDESASRSPIQKGYEIEGQPFPCFRLNITRLYSEGFGLMESRNSTEFHTFHLSKMAALETEPTRWFYFMFADQFFDENGFRTQRLEALLDSVSDMKLPVIVLGDVELSINPTGVDFFEVLE
ncbi:MAG: hypothetical protein ABQ298_12520 [Puniceicoccaceae bacterium]